MEEVKKAHAWILANCKEGWDKNPDFVKASDEKKAEQWEFLAKMYCIIKDLIWGGRVGHFVEIEAEMRVDV